MNPDQQLDQLLDSIEVPPASAALKTRIIESTRSDPDPLRNPFNSRFGPSLALASAVVMIFLAVLIIPAAPPHQEELDLAENEELLWLISEISEMPLEPTLQLDDEAAYSVLYGIDE